MLITFVTFLVIIVVCVVISFFWAHDSERHGGPWYEHIEDVVLDCDGTPIEEYKKGRGTVS